MSPRLDDTSAIMTDPRAVTLTIGSDNVTGLLGSPAAVDLDVVGNSPSLLVRAAALPASAVAGASGSIGSDQYTIKAVRHLDLLWRAIDLEITPSYDLLTLDLAEIMTETWIDEEHPTSPQSSTGLVTLRGGGTGHRANGIIRIPAISSSIPAGAVVVSAELLVYANPSTGPVWVCHRLLRPLVIAQATWNIWRTGQAWSVAGGLGLGVDYTVPPLGSGTGSGEGGYFSLCSGSDFTANVKARKTSAWSIVIHASGTGTIEFFMSDQGADIAPILRLGYHL